MDSVEFRKVPVGVCGISYKIEPINIETLFEEIIKHNKNEDSLDRVLEFIPFSINFQLFNDGNKIILPIDSYRDKYMFYLKLLCFIFNNPKFWNINYFVYN